MQQLTKDIYVETGFEGANVGLVVTGEGAVLVDTPMSSPKARRWREEIARVTEREIAYVINTDYHGEHILGNRFFPGVVVAHELVWKKANDEAFRRRLFESLWKELISKPEDLEIVPPQLTFTDRMILYLGGKTIEMIHLGGYTPASIGVYIPQDGVLFAGEVVINDEHPSIAEGESLQWLCALTLIRRMDVEVVVPGHGPLCKKEATHKLSSYIRKMRKKVKRQVESRRGRKEMMKRIDLGRIMEFFPVAGKEREEVEKRIKTSLRRIYDEMKEEF